MNPSAVNERVLLTGATGYVGGRLLARLERDGIAVRCMARRPHHLASRVAETTEVVYGDVDDRKSLGPALQGVDTAYYLIHGLDSAGDFEKRERAGAEHFAQAARDAGVGRIVYLGGLADDATESSAHMRSRHEVGDILRASGVPTVEFQASIIVGAGSASFEMVRSLVERLPVMVTPRWVQTLAQPIHIDDVLNYLVAARGMSLDESRCFQIGGQDRVTYLDLMKSYSHARGLRRAYIQLPFLTPYLSSLWLNLVTPLLARVGRRLIASVTTPSVVRDDSAREAFEVRPRGLQEAITDAIREEDAGFVQTRWSDALGSMASGRPHHAIRYGRRLLDTRVRNTWLTPKALFPYVERIGGENGWYHANALWRLRGALDIAAGGVGMGRGRRHPTELSEGDVVDCWRVEVLEPESRLLLRAEMRLPGRAWLQFEVWPTAHGARIQQTALFDPMGLFGLLYWYSIYPLHQYVFEGMLASLVGAAEEAAHKGPEASRTMGADGRKAQHEDVSLPAGAEETGGPA